jgi:glycosyltransferase involved in cell wall biosynthesis
LALNLGVSDAVHFTGAIDPDELHESLSAADVFVLATSGEGWANVFLEALACGLPVVATDVGGNAEVVGDDSVGIVVPPSNPEELQAGIAAALRRNWNSDHIRAYACANGWDRRIEDLVNAFCALAPREGIAAASPGQPS